MVAERLKATYERVAAAARRAGRDPAGVRVVVVTKDRSPAEILAAYGAGVRDFGESRAQELVAKAAVLPEDVNWHFVGHLQRNKVRHVRPLVALLHSLDSSRLGAAWLKGPGRPPPVLVQVNVGREPQKHGVAPENAAAIVAQAAALGLEVRGLMTIAPQTTDPEQARRYFRRLAELRSQLREQHPGLDELSMGMTDDVEVAVEEGATVVRLGRAIFGPRHGTA